MVLRGPLGVGKTTVASALARRIGGTVISIDRITDPEWDGGSVGLFVRANAIVAARSRSRLARGTPVVIDGCFYWKTQLRDLEGRLPSPHQVVTLWAPLSVCIERDAHRPRPFGVTATREVYRKVGRFHWGLSIDARHDVGRIVEEIIAQLHPWGLAPERRARARASTPRRVASPR